MMAVRKNIQSSKSAFYKTGGSKSILREVATVNSSNVDYYNSNCGLPRRFYSVKTFLQSHDPNSSIGAGLCVFANKKSKIYS